MNSRPTGPVWDPVPPLPPLPTEDNTSLGATGRIHEEVHRTCWGRVAHWQCAAKDQPLGVAVDFLPGSSKHKTESRDPTSVFDSKLPAGRTRSDPSPYPH